MPTTYAHDRFGREVYEQLPVNLKKIIRENKKLYLILSLIHISEPTRP